MTKDELQKAVDDVITDCIRNDYAFGNYAHRVTEAVWPVLEAAEKERDDVAQQLVQSEIGKRAISEECDALRNEIAYVKEVEFPRKAQAVADGWKGKCKRLEVERDALRAKIAEMERQEPVAWYSKQYGFVYMSRHSSQFKHGSILYLRNGTPALRIEGSSRVALLNMASLPHGTVFYALPGAKGEEK